MSLVTLAHVCSHLQNASKARLGVTSVPASNLVLRLMLGLHAAGFLSFVVRGGPQPPVFASPTSLVPEMMAAPPPPTTTTKFTTTTTTSSSSSSSSTATTPTTTTSTMMAGASAGVSASASVGVPASASASASAAGMAAPLAEPLTQANIASRRLWLGLKYWDNEPVLRRMSLLSRPTRRTWLDAGRLEQLVRGRTTGYVRGLTRPGECIFVTTDRGVMEARECVERRIGGMLLCRVL
jgi:ribosomal protein S8